MSNNGKPPKRELAVIAAKIPRGIVVRLDRAANNSWNTRNAVISRVLEQYLTGAAGQSRQRPTGIFGKYWLALRRPEKRFKRRSI